jgi:hypothetical protein
MGGVNSPVMPFFVGLNGSVFPRQKQSTSILQIPFCLPVNQNPPHPKYLLATPPAVVIGFMAKPL